MAILLEPRRGPAGCSRRPDGSAPGPPGPSPTASRRPDPRGGSCRSELARHLPALRASASAAPTAWASSTSTAAPAPTAPRRRGKSCPARSAWWPRADTSASRWPTPTGAWAISLILSAGNEAVVDATDYLEYLVEDPGTRVIAAFIEQFRRPERLPELARRARAAGKPDPPDQGRPFRDGPQGVGGAHRGAGRCRRRAGRPVPEAGSDPGERSGRNVRDRRAFRTAGPAPAGGRRHFRYHPLRRGDRPDRATWASLSPCVSRLVRGGEAAGPGASPALRLDRQPPGRLGFRAGGGDLRRLVCRPPPRSRPRTCSWSPRTFRGEWPPGRSPSTRRWPGRRRRSPAARTSP